MPQRNASITQPSQSLPLRPSAGAVLLLFGIVAAIFSPSSPSLVAQSSSPSLLFGPIVEIEGRIGRTDNPIPVYSLSSACGTFDRTGLGTGLRLGLEGRLAPARWNGFGLTGRVAVLTDGIRFTALPLDEQRAVNEATGALETLEREFRLDYAATTIALAPLLTYRTAAGWHLAAGLDVGYRLTGSFSQTDNVLGPGDRRFRDGQGTHPMEEGIPFTLSRWSLGPVLSLSRLFPLKNGLIVAPQISARGDLLSPAGQAPWRTYALSVGTALFLNLSPGLPPPPLPPDEPVPPPAPAVPRPRTTVQIFGLDESGVESKTGTIRVWEVLYEQRLPLLPSIFFDRGSATLPERYAADPQSSPEAIFSGAAGSDSATGFDWTLMRANHHLPGILAERMARFPESVLEVAGSASGDEPSEEANRRSERVRELLAAQGISPDRIRIIPLRSGRSDERTADGKEENRRTELSSADARLTEPLTLRQVVREYSPPAIRIVPDFEAAAGVREWRIEVLYRDSVMADYTSKEKADGLPPDFGWRINQRRGDTSVAPIIARFHIVDSLGRESVAWDTIRVELAEERSVVEGDVETDPTRRRSSLWIIGFAYDSDGLTEKQKREMELIAEKIDEGAQVTVAGYTDRIGTERYNTALSQKRAERVAEYLQTVLARRGVGNVSVTAVGKGVDQGLFDNDLPEGRHLSRSVVITVEKEIGKEIAE